MAELAIKGHPSRGKEVIEILKMLGGKNIHNCDGTFNECYAIDNNKICTIYTNVAKIDNCIIFTLEEFLKKYPYKVGDEVEYKSIGDANLKSKIIYMEWCNSLNAVLYTTEDAQVISTEDIIETKSFPPYMDYDIKEDKGILVQIDFTRELRIADEVEVILGDYEFVLKDGKTYFVKKNKYPKTYEECCNILGVEDRENGYCGYEYELLGEFQKLYICRDAYWKIAGEQMGLGKPWKPDYCDEHNMKYIIYICRNKINLSLSFVNSHFLAFPTSEIRDAFYNNFNNLIEQCKELL